MNPVRLVLGTVLLAFLYGVFGPKAIDNLYYWAVPIEAALYSAVLLLAHKGVNAWNGIGLVVISAVVNYIFMVLWWGVLALPMLIGQSLGAPEDVSRIFAFAFYSAFGALVYCMLLDLFLRPKYFNKATYFMAIGFCAFAGFPAMLPQGLFIPLHKVLWWFMFSSALIASWRMSVGRLAVREPTGGFVSGVR